jgi:microcystin-dependent protein
MATVNLSPLFNGVTNFSATGVLLNGGQLYTYQAGSSTPLATYTTVNGNIANANPIVLGSDGKIPNELWLQYGYSYKFVLQDANSNLIGTYDNISGIITQIPATSPAVPSGCILIWSGSVGSIPSGWTLCNGSNSTPDLRDKFVIGAGNSYAVGATGGTSTVTLTQNNLPNVNFTTTVTDPGHSHTVYAAAGGGGTLGGGSGIGLPNTQTTSTSFTGITVAVNSGGSSTAISILPPYYALAYIMKS